ncbi:aminopeptidase PepB [Pleionea sp. CnH1-48]|uniref:aminopeptidase PepB n=1 Tax=Pleionea sp. CnH1-48 TaxID=2954494 RepID=UPI0020981B07|nr:aminopeptidase PepB [Pleionea sp. CnH1-48]MCO7227348.1 aminopeptidase PepB [Pleionea sp. CnH1-48]
MNQKLHLRISESAPEGIWPASSLLSFDADEGIIHLKKAMRLRCIQAAGRRLLGMGFQQFKLVGEGWDKEHQFAFAQAMYSARFVPEVEWAELEAEEANDLQALIKTSYWCRQQINHTPEDLSPVVLAQNAADFVSSFAPDQVSYRIVEGDDLATEGWVGIHGVGRGSNRPPALLELDFTPVGWGDKAPVTALVGKGITFDSGGYSLKASESMLHMKADMGGASTVTAALALAIARGLNTRVKLYLCCAENMVSGHAYKLGDVLTYKNGVSVEVVNTDAEGRLVLADGLILATESKAKNIFDAATLTGAAVTAVGDEYNAVFSFDVALREAYLNYSAAECEAHWPLPLDPHHATNCPSSYADTANSRPVKGGGPGGASNAAGFLSRFVGKNCQWLHVDLASAMNASDSAYLAAGGSGHGIRTLARALLEQE